MRDKQFCICGNCFHYDGAPEDNHAECCRFPPTTHVRRGPIEVEPGAYQTGDIIDVYNPIVRRERYCGEWKWRGPSE